MCSGNWRVGVAVESQSEDQTYKLRSKRPLDEMPEGIEEVKKARTTLFVDALPSDSAVPVGQGLNWPIGNLHVSTSKLIDTF